MLLRTIDMANAAQSLDESPTFVLLVRRRRADMLKPVAVSEPTSRAEGVQILVGDVKQLSSGAHPRTNDRHARRRHTSLRYEILRQRNNQSRLGGTKTPKKATQQPVSALWLHTPDPVLKGRAGGVSNSQQRPRRWQCARKGSGCCACAPALQKSVTCTVARQRGAAGGASRRGAACLSVSIGSCIA